MKLLKALELGEFPKSAVEVYKSSGIQDLYPPQAEAVEKGLFADQNILLSIPTAAGKTLMAELGMLHSIVHKDGFCLYIAPLKALASEKYKEFKTKFAPLGIQVGLAIGDVDSPSKNLNRYKIIVATAEKVDSLLRSKAQWLIGSLTTVVLDEIHFINDGSRGPTMEILIARIRQLNDKVRFIGLSATIQNANEMAEWLNAQLVQSDWRPIPLKEGVYFNNRIQFEDATTKYITAEAPDDVSRLTMDTLHGGGQVLVFVNSRRSAQAVSRQVGSSVHKILTDEEKQKLELIAKKIGGSRADSTKVCQKLADIIRNGAAFHHAGLKPQQRELIEESFKKNLIKVIGCTPTLAAGVNLPARRAIIRDCKRFDSAFGQVYIPTSEYKQCAGRAGRPQYDEYGEAILMAKTQSQSYTLFEKYIEAESEPVTSKLGNESSLRIHILASISGGYIHDVNGMLDFISHTFLAHQKQEPNLLEMIADIFEFLHQEKFIEKSGYRFFATTLGALTSRLYIDPLTAITIREGLNLIENPTPYSTVGMLHLLTCCPDAPRLNVGKKNMTDLETFAAHFENDFLLTPENCGLLEDYYAHLATFKTTWLLTQWIEEDKEDNMCDVFGIGPGDIYRIIESLRWLLYAAGRIADLQQKKNLTFQIENLRNRVRYGIKEELLNITTLKGVGRVRARILFEKGYRSLSDLKMISVEDLGAIRGIGKTLAKDIHSQILSPLKLKSY